LVGGSEVTPVIATTSGADGYYYLLLAPGTISSSGSNIFAYIADAGTTGNTAFLGIKSSPIHADIIEGDLRLWSRAADSATIIAELDDAVGSNSGAQFLYTSGGGFNSSFKTILSDMVGTFTIDSDLNFGTGTFVIDGGNIDVDGAVQAKTLMLVSTGAVSESAAGALDVNKIDVTAQTGIDLDSDLNDITKIGTDTTASGPNMINKN
jgi:hypothetical protein